MARGRPGRRSRFTRRLLAPIDDEPETVEEREAVAEARADYAAGRVKTTGQVRRELLG